MSSHRPTLKLATNAVGHGSVVLDGHDISRVVSGAVIKAEVGEPTTVLLRLIGTELDLEVEGELATVFKDAATSIADERRK